MINWPSHIRWCHSHIYFNEKTRDFASILRHKISEAFPPPVTVHELIDVPIGPHPLPMFEVDISRETIHAFQKWMSNHHGELSVLIHPLSGNAMDDHRTYPIWVGQPLPLKLEFLEGL